MARTRRARFSWRRLVMLGVGLAAVGFAVVQFWNSTSSDTFGFNDSFIAGEAQSFPATYALQPQTANELRNGPAVDRALGFLRSLQPEGTYVLSQPGDPRVVPMDISHVVIALAKVHQIDRAEAAMSWQYAQMIRKGDANSRTGDGVDFSGSWYDAMSTDGRPMLGTSRGRGEAVGMSLIATYTIAQEDPSYLDTMIGDRRVVDLMQMSVDYLTQPAMQQPNGTFSHSPEYRVAFNEECARMTLGLRLAGTLLKDRVDTRGAVPALSAADRGLVALRERTGMSQGMAYDFYAMGIWGLGSRQDALGEVKWLKSTGLVDRDGVRNWDWQLAKANPISDHLKWWAQSQSIAPSQTFDYAIACISAGDIQTALDLERRWLPRQLENGGFQDAFYLGLRIGLAPPTSYSAARFILLERLLSDVVGGGAKPL